MSTRSEMWDAAETIILSVNSWEVREGRGEAVGAQNDITPWSIYMRILVLHLMN